jgi:hypothetical protein
MLVDGRLAIEWPDPIMSESALIDRVLAHSRTLVRREIVACLDEPTSRELAYAVGTLIGERDADWLAPGEVRVASVARRDELLAQFPDAGPEVVWNVAEFDLAEAPLISNLIDPDVHEEEEAISMAMTARYGDRAGEVYDEQLELALREVPWHRWFRLTSDFVVFSWYDGHGALLRASLERNAPPGAVARWMEMGWMP